MDTNPAQAAPAAKQKTKIFIRYRVHVGGSYCKISRDYDPRGTLVPGFSIHDAEEFLRANSADAAIGQTYSARSAVRDSMFRDWPKLQSLMFEGDLIREEYRVELSVSD